MSIHQLSEYIDQISEYKKPSEFLRMLHDSSLNWNETLQDKLETRSDIRDILELTEIPSDTIIDEKYQNSSQWEKNDLDKWSDVKWLDSLVWQSIEQVLWTIHLSDYLWKGKLHRLITPQALFDQLRKCLLPRLEWEWSTPWPLDNIWIQINWNSLNSKYQEDYPWLKHIDWKDIRSLRQSEDWVEAISNEAFAGALNKDPKRKWNIIKHIADILVNNKSDGLYLLQKELFELDEWFLIDLLVIPKILFKDAKDKIGIESYNKAWKALEGSKIPEDIENDRDLFLQDNWNEWIVGKRLLQVI